MPVKFHKPVTPLLTAIGISKELVDALDSGGWLLAMQPTELTLTRDIGGNVSVHKIPVKSTTLIEAAKSATMPPMKLQTLRAMLTAEIKKALDLDGQPVPEKLEPVTVPPKAESVTAPVMTPANAPKIKMADFGKYQHMAEAMKLFQPVANADIGLGVAVPMMNAGAIYWPVRGSTASSRYFLMAVFGTFRVAARLQTSGQLSLRFEGTVPFPVQQVLASLSFENHNGYLSIHVMTTGPEEAQRFLGCVLGQASMVADMLTPMPNVGLIAGKGA